MMHIHTKEDLLTKIRTYLNESEITLLSKAFDYAVEMHGSQKRASGDPYFLHPVEVATLLADMKLDVSSIITGLLHDTVEDTEATLEDIRVKFGKDVSILVDGVTKLTKIEFQSDRIRQAENFRKLLIAMSKDIRVLLVKLADRLHNMRTLSHISSSEKRMRIAHETMEIYAPLAERIGIHQYKNELQDLAFAELYPDVRLSIVSRLDYLRGKAGNIIKRISTELEENLARWGLHVKVTGREKTPCSIWQKMERINIGFEQLTDIVAFRINVNSVAECYHALGCVHSFYQMIPESFRDFISTPKNNGYQSLHTIIMGPEYQRIEIQIRTEQMHEISELGVAAHWSYKQNTGANQEGKEYNWIRRLLQILENENIEEFIEHTKLEMYYEQVFCFTPRGDLIALPRGATPVDFAFAVHTDMGLHCTGAKVNGRIVPLKSKLENGDQVHIIVDKTQTPSPNWEQFVVTGKARSEIKRFARSKQKQEYYNLGKAIVAKVLHKEEISYTEKDLITFLPLFRKKNIDDLYIAVGGGVINKNDIISAFSSSKQPEKKKQGFLSLLQLKKKKNPKESEFAVPITGLIPGMAVHFAGCCHPLPGDKIVAIVNAGKGIAIHTTDCEVLEHFAESPERWIDVAWEKEGVEEIYIGRIKSSISHEVGSLAGLCNAVAQCGGNINNLRITHRSIDFFELILDVEVKGATHLTHVIASLRACAFMHSVERVRG